MKNRSKISAVISAILLIAVAAGCKHNVLGSFNDLETRKPEVDVYTTVKGTIENYAEVIHETVTQNNNKPAARTIAPDIVKSGYKFFIYGEMGNSFTGPFEITDDMIGGVIDAEKQGTFEVTLKKGAWNLTLVAFNSEEFEYNESNALTKSPFAGDAAVPTREECGVGFADKASLISKVYVDLADGNTSDVKFTLSPEGLSGKGKVDFYMVLDGWTLPEEIVFSGTEKNLKVTGSIKDLKTNETVDGTELNTLTVEVVGDTKVTTTDKIVLQKDTQYIHYELKESGALKDLAPGTYSFILEFENTKTHKKWTWNDRIMIFPKDTTDETQYLQEIIMKSPKAPEWLYASAVKKSTDPYIPKTNDFDASDDYYQVVFQWADWALTEDASPKPEDISNETHFELQIGDITGIKAETVDFANKTKTENLFKHTAATESDPEKYETNFTDSGDQPQSYPVMIFDQSAPSNLYYVDGSMLANNQKLTVNLELGKQYVARIRAVNDTGASDWTYVELKNEDEDKPHFPTKVAAAAAHITLDGEYFKGSTINNYRVRYYLNGGESVKADPDGWTWKGDFIDYYGPVKEDDDSIGLYFIDFYKDGAGLKNGDILLTGWKEGSSSNAPYYPVSVANAESAPTFDKSTYETISGYGDYKAKMNGTTKQDNGNGVVISKTRVYLTKDAFDDGNAAIADDAKGKWSALTTGPYSNVKITKKSSDKMKLYEGYANLALWAQYPAEFNWEIVTINELTPDLIRYQVVQADGTAVPAGKIPTYINASGASEACPEYSAGAAGETPAVPAGTTLTVSENKSVTATFHPSEKKDEDFYNIKWTLDASKVAYRYFRVTIKQSDGSDRTIDTQKDITVSEKTFEVTTDVSDCRKGHYYNVLIEAGLPNSMLASTIPVVLYIK